MKKVILSAIIGALFGGAVVFTATQPNFFQQNQMIANAKGLPETPENKIETVQKDISKKEDSEQKQNMYDDIFYQHYGRFFSICTDKITKRNYENTGHEMTTGTFAACFEGQNTLAEQELRELLIFTTNFKYKDDKEFDSEMEKIDNEFEKWKEERDKECQGMLEKNEITGLGIYECKSHSTIAYITGIYNSNYKKE